MDTSSLPLWRLDSIYPGVDSDAFTEDLNALDTALTQAIELASAPLEDPSLEGARSRVRALLAAEDEVSGRFETLEAFCYASYSVETGNERATAALNTVMERTVRTAELEVRLRDALAGIVAQMPGGVAELVDGDPVLTASRFLIEEALLFQRHQMSAAEEQLAADLNRSGGNAWSRLQETVSSELSAPWAESSSGATPETPDSPTGTKTVVELRALAHNADRSVRERAFHTEIDAWRRMETPLAFALNGVKGTAHTVNVRRGWKSTLERSAHQNRISTAALDALITTMRESLPLFRRYLHAKARVIEVPRLAFYDLFAPVGTMSTVWDYERAATFIVEQFAAFDPEQGEFARHAFDRSWIDARPRPGKVGGAYCIDFPERGESRILANFDGTYDGMSTLAHELGHAWHSHQLRDLPVGQRHYPMTLAETASIFSETLVFQNALTVSPESEQLFLIEQFLQGTTQVVVDILSRFDFESAVMERRPTHELSAREFCELMTAAQRNTYGDALDPELLHPYMWAVKGHYYSPDLAFYNFPYAFGQLFALGLYAHYQREPEGFAARYRAMLRETGRADAVTVTRRMQCDIESPTFWQSALEPIATLVEQFEQRVRHL